MLGVLGWLGSLRLQKRGFDHLMYHQRELISSIIEMLKQLTDGITMEACLIPLHSP